MIKVRNIQVILNPTAGGDRAGKMIPEIKTALNRKLREVPDLQITQGPGEATRLTRRAIQAGADLIVAAGGDGTIQEVINGFYLNRKLINPDCELGIINLGTGQGFAHSLRLPESIKEQAELLNESGALPVDVGCVVYQDDRGKERERLFMNECQAGIGGDVVARVGKKYKIWGGTVAFGLAAVQEILFGRSYPVRIQIGRHKPIETELIGLVAGNGSRMGGGMQLTPGARPDDGLFDILLIHHMPIFKKLFHFTRIYSGKHLRSKYFVLRQGSHIRMDASEPVRIEADGELLGWLPAEITLLPEPLFIKSNLLSL